MPTTADEYERFAKECIGWARTAKSEADRKAFLDMARAWTQAAAKVSGTITAIPLNDADSELSH